MELKTWAKGPVQSKGLTLVELMTTLAVAAVLVFTAVPNFTSFIQNNRMATQVNELNTSLSLGRSEAVKRNRNITICRSSNGTGCTGDWQSGWIVFVDNDFDGTVDAGDEILRVHGGMPGNNTLSFSQTRVTYAGTGIARNGSSGTFTFCDPRGETSASGLVIGPSGRPRLAIDSDSNGTLNDGGDGDLTCSA